MGRFGPITARFYSLSDISTPLNLGGTTHQAVSGSFDDNASGMGQASLVFVNNSNLNTLAAVGKLCWAVKTDAVRTDLGDGEVTFAEPFIIRERITIPGTDMIEIRGPLLHSDLSRWTIYRLYTSAAADDLLCVALCGHGIYNKQNSISTDS